MATEDDIDDVVNQLSKASVGDKVIDFSGKGLKLDNSNDAKVIADAINAADEMHVLRLNGNTLGVDAAKVLSDCLKKHPEFQRAQWSDLFTGRMKTEIPPALQHLGNGIMSCNAHLVELDVSDNAFGPNGMNGIKDLLVHPSCFTLQELKLNNNGLGPTGGKMLAACLLECYHKSVAASQPLALRVFISGRGRLESEGSVALSEVFKLMGSLEEVSMPQNGIFHVGISALAEAFAANRNLKKLNLNDNTFTEKGAAAMAKALPEMTQLEVLDFGDCLLRTEGGKLIAEALSKRHTKLKEVILSFNEIGSSGAIPIAEAMSGKFNLDILDLNGNQLGEEGIESVTSIMEALDHGNHLGSFSDDEGDSDDQDGSSDSTDENDQDSDNDIIVTTPKNGTKIMSADEFFQFPSPSKLTALGDNPEKIVQQHIQDNAVDSNSAIDLFLKVSCIINSNNDDLLKTVCQCADVLLSSAYNNAEHSTVTNQLLIHLGLIKSESKARVISDISGPLLVLAHSVKQSYFPVESKSILQCFIGQPNHKLERVTKQKHILLQSLYS